MLQFICVRVYSKQKPQAKKKCLKQLVRKKECDQKESNSSLSNTTPTLLSKIPIIEFPENSWYSLTSVEKMVGQKNVVFLCDYVQIQR